MGDEHYTFVEEPKGQPKDCVPTGYLICNHCGSRVETGIITVSEHWFHCQERVKKQGRSIIERLVLLTLK